MTANPYAIPVDELESRVRVPVEELVEVETEPQVPVLQGPGPRYPLGDGGDVDGD